MAALRCYVSTNSVSKVSDKRPNQKHARFAHERFQEFLQQHDIVIPQLPLEALRTKALKKWRFRNHVDFETAASLPQEFLDWIAVNWIRHQCCEYDQTLRWFQASLRNDMHRRLKLHVLDMIQKQYPELAVACAHQSVTTD